MWDGEGGISDRLLQKRMQAMDSLADDINKFTNDMRDHGAQIVWALMDNDELSNYGDLHHLQRQDGDLEIRKTAQSALPENTAFFEELKAQAEQDGKDLEIKVCGVWALECIANTAVTLHEAGYDMRVVGDLILDSAKPCMDDDRPDFAEAHALHAIGSATGLGAEVSQWSEDVVAGQKAIASAHSKNVPDGFEL